MASGTEGDGATLPARARQDARVGKGSKASTMDKGGDDMSVSGMALMNEKADEEALAQHPNRDEEAEHTASVTDASQPMVKSATGPRIGTLAWVRGTLADIVEYMLSSEDVAFALKFAVAVYLVTFPAFVKEMNGWYNSVRGVWAPLQLILVFEPSIGTSIWVFLVRAVGVVYGCVAGYLSYQIGGGNYVVLVAVLVVAMIPAAYVHLNTPYAKAAQIAVVSMVSVALSKSWRFVALLRIQDRLKHSYAHT